MANKIKTLLLVVLVCILPSCLYEPAPTFYVFTIVNKSQQIIYIKSKTIDDEYCMYDTLKSKDSYQRKFTELHCYCNYNDSLVNTFFKEINITPTILKNLYNKSNWSEKFALKNSGKDCKSGYVYYTLEIK